MDRSDELMDQIKSEGPTGKTMKRVAEAMSELEGLERKMLAELFFSQELDVGAIPPMEQPPIQSSRRGKKKSRTLVPSPKLPFISNDFDTSFERYREIWMALLKEKPDQ